jgi:hypothetical protein
VGGGHGPEPRSCGLLASSRTPHAALAQWVDLFVDFLITKHGLAAALQSDHARFETLHACFLDRLVPACAQLLDGGEVRPGTNAIELLQGIGNLCIGGGDGGGGDSSVDGSPPRPDTATEAEAHGPR